MRNSLSIRTMSPDEVALALAWARDEGWNPGLDDASAFRAADPDGFLMGFLGDEPVAAISAVAYGDTFGFIGLYICKPEFRGRGHGMEMWRAALARLGKRTVGLDGVLAQQAAYARSDFVLAHRNIRYGGIATSDTPADPRLTMLGKGLYPSVRDYDRYMFGAPREEFLRGWVAPDNPTRRGFAVIEDGKFAGYGAIRACDEGFKIGPLFADSQPVADLLFRALAGQVRGQMVFLDTPEPNAAAAAMAERHELSPVFETARMYRGADPELPLQKIYGITTFELG